MPRPSRALGAALLLVVALLLAGCGGSSSSGASGSGSGQTKTIDITFQGDSVTPNGERVSVGVDQPIVLHVEADAPGEIHVHSSPEQELQYGAGTTDLKLRIDQPGLVEVESHSLDKQILQLEVS